MANIQWYPGHMAKAIRQMQEQMSSVDIVLELLDARIPASSKNVMVADFLNGKPHLLVLTKSDLADERVTKEWITFYQKQGHQIIAVDSRSNTLEDIITKKIKEILADKIQNKHDKGIQNVSFSCMVVGIPNVGKSTFLNHMLHKNIAVTADRPGVTKKQEFLKTKKGIKILDTPGILWPKFDNEDIGNKLAFTGAIKDNLFAEDDVVLYGLEILVDKYATGLMDRYGLIEADLKQSLPDLLLKITNKLGFKDDYAKASWRILNDARQGKLGQISLDFIDNAN